MNPYHRRHLPHWQPDGQVFFVTLRLFGSLPQDAIGRLKQEARTLRKQPTRPNETPRERALREAKRLFALVDDALADQIRRGRDNPSLWLSKASLAEMVQEAIHYRDGKVFALHPYVIMPNHVHLLIEPLQMGQAIGLSRRFRSGQANSLSYESQSGQANSLSYESRSGQADSPSYFGLSGILQSLKGYTARRANQMLGRSGVFWQGESYDHWVRDEDEYHRIVWYIDQNPVKAGLCKSPEGRTWSTMGGRKREAGTRRVAVRRQRLADRQLFGQIGNLPG